MKALVLAGGTGSRLRPLSHTMPKQLVPVAGRPVLFHCLDSIRAAGITETAIVVGDWEAEIRSAVGDGGEFGLRITYLPQRDPLGLAHCVLLAQGFLGSDDFVMYLGDNILVGGIADLVADFRAGRPDTQLVVQKVPNPSEYGIAQLDDDGRVLRLAEKPEDPSGDLAVVGVYLFGHKIHDAVRRITPSGRGELEITDAIQWLITSGADVRARVFSGYWKDTGCLEDLLDGNRMLLESIEPVIAGDVDDSSSITGPVVVSAGARIRRSRLSGPVIVGPGTTVSESFVGPFTALGADCVVDNAGISDSIVLDGSSIQRVHHVSRSLIGRSSQVEPTPKAGAQHRLVLGDNCAIELPETVVR